MSELPNGWCGVPVSEAVSNLPLTGKKIPQKQYLEAGAYPVIDQGQPLVGGYSDDAEALVDCEPPVIVFGDHTKVVKLVKFQFAPGADGIKVLKPHQFFDCLLFKYFLDHITAGMIDKGYARHYQHLANSQVHLPPLAEQRRIVAKVEELFSELDEGVANLKKARAQLAVYRQALLKHAFEGHLTADWRTQHDPELESADQLLARILDERRQNWEGRGKYKEPAAPDMSTAHVLPESWACVSWEMVLAPEDGAFKRGPFGSALTKAIFVDKGFKVYEQYCPINDDCSFARYYITPEKFEELRMFEVKAGDYLVSCSGSLGRITRVPQKFERGIINQALLRVRINERVINHRYFLHLFRSGRFQKEIFDNSTGTAIPNVKGVKELKAMAIPLPSLLEQVEVVSKLEEQISIIAALETDIDLNLQKAQALRQSILKKAFAGELVPQDPADEPAAALLARIRAERAAQATTKPTRRAKPPCPAA